LLSWLDERGDSEGRQYLEMRHRLVRYFERKNCVAADDLADETLSRVARRLEESGTITDATPAQYCYITAKFVFYEYLRRREAEAAFQHNLSSPKILVTASQPANDLQEKMLVHLENCLERLAPDDRELMLEYYRGTQREKIERRHALAERLGVSPNALTIRACRLRAKLEACVRAASEKL
jgi:DNA-directed RNA polymerase specialized sigma24 family protein